MMHDEIEAQAARWYAAQDSDAMDWDGFTAWLEADPRHRAAFDEIALLGDALDTHRAAIAPALSVEAANDNRPERAPRRWWGLGAGGAVAAALALALLGLPHTPAAVTYSAGRGESRIIALAGGSRITLASSSKLTIAGRDQDALALQGSAYFDVPHREGRTLTVRAGGVEVRDIGTRFAVTGGAAGARVEVASGMVSVASDRFATPVRVTAGNALVADLADGKVRLGAVDPGSVASWRRGQLRYADAPLVLVAEEISRYAGKPVHVDPALRGRSFSGVLTIGDGSRLASTLGTILAIDVRQDAGTIRLSPR